MQNILQSIEYSNRTNFFLFDDPSTIRMLASHFLSFPKNFKRDRKKHLEKFNKTTVLVQSTKIDSVRSSLQNKINTNHTLQS